MIFCRLEGADVLSLDGGPSGGNGLADMEALEGEVMADGRPLPWDDPRPELVDDEALLYESALPAVAA